MKKVLERLFCVCAIAFTFMLLNAVPARAAKGDFHSIQIGTPPDKLFYDVGEVFDPKGMEVEALFDDGNGDYDIVDVTDFSFSPSGQLTLNDNKITISYTVNGVTKTCVQYIGFYVPESLEISAYPAKDTYVEGESFDPKGMKAIVHYKAFYDVGFPDDADVTGSVTWEPSGSLTYNEETDGVTAITFSYTRNGTTVTNEYTVHVFPSSETLVGLEIISQPDIVNYNEDDYFCTTGMVLKAKYADGSSKEIQENNITYDIVTRLKTSNTQIEISYSEHTITKTVTQPITVYPRTESTLKLVWDDNNDQYGMRPQKLNVRLRDKDELDTLNYIISESDGWIKAQKKLEQYINNKKLTRYWEVPNTEGYVITGKVTEGTVTTVTFKVIPPAEITKIPEVRTGLAYNEKVQELITTGEAEGGTFYYAVTESGVDPTDDLYTTSIPAKRDAGNYDVYYKVKGDKEHSDISPKKLETKINKGSYKGKVLFCATVPSGQVKTDVTFNLPALTEGERYSYVGMTQGQVLISGTPDVDGETLTYSTTSQPAGTSTQIFIGVNSPNYFDYFVFVTVTASDKTEAGVSIKGGDRTVEYGDTGLTLSGEVINAGEGTGTWTWECMDTVTSSGSEIAEIDSNGAVTIKKTGSTIIKATYTSETTTGAATIRLTVDKRNVTINGVTVSDKEYDGTTNAVIGSSGKIDGAVDGDDVSIVPGTAHFKGKNAGRKTVYFRGFSLTGADADKYRLASQPEDTAANIGKITITADVEAVDRAYMRGNTTVALTGGTLSGIIDGDWVAVDRSTMKGRMADANAGTGKPVEVTGLSLKNPDAVNYVLRQPEGLKVNISKAALDPPAALSRTYPYREEAKDSIDLSVLLPKDTGTVTYMSPISGGNVSYREAPAVSEGILSYVLDAGSGDKSGTITVTAQMQNYNDTVLTVNVKQIALALYEKKGGKKYEVCSSKNLNTGKSFTLVPMFADGTVLNKGVVWSSANPGVATVTQGGKVTGYSGGETAIIVMSEENPLLSAYCYVRVAEPVTEITLDKKNYSFGTEETVELTASVLPFTAVRKLKWTADNENVSIAVSDDTLKAIVTGKKAGKAKVTAEAADNSGKKATCSFKIGTPVPDFSIAGRNNVSDVEAGKTLKMTVSWSAGKPSNTEVTWELTGTNANYIASITDKGVLTGIMAGKVTVTAVSRANPNRKASADITVTKPAGSKKAGITGIGFTNTDNLVKKGLSAGKGHTIKTKLTMSGEGSAAGNAVAWVTSDPGVATVSQKGAVKAVAPGTVTITAIARDAADINTAPKATVTFNVHSRVKHVKLDKKKLTLGTQDGIKYGKVSIASVVPAFATDLSMDWTVNDKCVALAAIPEDEYPSEGSFEQAGSGITTKAGEAVAVMAVSPGRVKLTGITKDGSKKKVTCTITVRGEVTGLALKTLPGNSGINNVTLSGDAVMGNTARYNSSMKAGGSIRLTPVFTINGVDNTRSTAKTYKAYKKYTDLGVSYRSSDISVAVVDRKGRIKVQKKASAGKSAVIHGASTDGQYTVEVLVTVK